MSFSRTARMFALTAAIALLGTACRVDWSSWGNGPDRQGNNTFETGIGTSNASQLHQLWSVDLGGYINAAPIEAINMPVLGGTHDLLYVGTERGDFYAVTTDGQVVWRRTLGIHVANCPDTPGDIYGVQASAVFDRATNRVYVMGGNGYVYALDATTGEYVPGWPVQLDTDPAHNSVYGAPNLFNGYLYIGTGSHCDDPPYHGHVVRVDVNTRATLRWYANGVGPNGVSGGGIWGWGGVSVDSRDGNVYVATGNVFANPENSPYGDSIVRLTPDLKLVSYHTPPALITDDDFGSTPMLFQKSGCPPELAAEQKNGSVYIYDRDNLSAGPRQRLVLSVGSDAQHLPTPVREFIGVTAYSPQLQMMFVSNPTGTDDGSYTNGMVAFRINSACMLEKAWNTTAGTKGDIVGTPTIANGVVYYSDGGGKKVHAFNASTGQELWNSGSSVNALMFTEPLVVNGKLFMGAYDDRLHAWGV